MKPHIYIVGMGPGSPDLVSQKAKEVIEDSQVLLAGKRHLELYENSGKELFVIQGSLTDMFSFIEKNKNKKMAVLASGDPMLYGVGAIVSKRFRHWDITIIPGVSAISYLAAAARVDISDYVVESVHGKDAVSIPNLSGKKNIALFTGGFYTPDVVCNVLDQLECDMDVIIGENLSYENEKITRGTLKELKNKTFSPLSTMLLTAKADNLPPFGIADNMFIRGDAPMTKEEVRAVSVAKLQLRDEDIVFDIGAGTGSISVASARQALFGTVYAIEQREERIPIIEKNRRRFGLHNIITVQGEAPSILHALPRPDKVFIGGTSGRWEEIIGWLHAQCPKVRVVANAVTLQSTEQCIQQLKYFHFQNIECIQVWVAKSQQVGGVEMLKGQNPIFIISGDKG